VIGRVLGALFRRVYGGAIPSAEMLDGIDAVIAEVAAMANEEGQNHEGQFA
jgi:hypothetical protein